MPKKRNHYVPQFLLRRFASRSQGKKKWVWQFRSSADPVEVVTKNAAVATYFYGKPATGVEDAFAELEGRQASLLRDLDTGQDPNRRSQELRELVWSLSFRTRAARSHFADTAERAIEHMRTADPQTMFDAFGREITNNFDDHLNEALANFPPAQQALFRKMLAQPGVASVAKETILRELAKVLPNIGAIFDHASGVIQEAAEDGHVKGLMKLFAQGKHVPEDFRVPLWGIEQFDANSVVLGDGVVFAAGPDGNLGALGKFKKGFEVMYLPIAHDRVLIGMRNQATSLLGLDEINAASVHLSLDTFIASQNTDAELALAKEIGNGEPILSNEELSQIAGDSWKSLGEPNTREG